MREIVLHPETQRLIANRLERGGFATADDMIRVALEALDAHGFSELDNDTVAAIQQAEAEYERGEGVSVDQAFA